MDPRFPYMKSLLTCLFAGMQQASINLTQSLHEVYEPDWHGKDDIVTIGKVGQSSEHLQRESLKEYCSSSAWMCLWWKWYLLHFCPHWPSGFLVLGTKYLGQTGFSQPSLICSPMTFCGRFRIHHWLHWPRPHHCEMMGTGLILCNCSPSVLLQLQAHGIEQLFIIKAHSGDMNIYTYGWSMTQYQSGAQWLETSGVYLH